MKQCPHCQKDIPEEAVFCIYCMTELTEKTEIPTGSQASSGCAKKRALILSLCALIGVFLVVFAVLFFRKTGTPAETMVFPEEDLFYSRADGAAKELGLDFSLRDREDVLVHFRAERSGIDVQLNDWKKTEEKKAIALTEACSAAVYGYYPEGLGEHLDPDADGWDHFDLKTDLLDYASFRVEWPDGKEPSGKWQRIKFATERYGKSAVMTVYYFYPDSTPDRFSEIISFSPES